VINLTTYWAPLLHIYQPPTQDLEILRSIDKECYKPLFSLFEEYDNIKFCLNINGVLIELFYEFGLSDTMDLLKNLVSESKIEIVGTAKYHPILPLIPKKEAQHQIQMNEELNRREFGRWERNGFFPPEMAISGGVAKYIRHLGYKWVIMSGIACPVEWPYDKISCSPNGLQLFFRDDILSNKISFKDITAKEFIKSIKEIFQPKDKIKINPTKKFNRYIITAMDGETFGHHIKNYEKTFLKKVLDLIQMDEKIKLISISELDQHFPISNERIIPRESSWSTTYEDIKDGIPYPLWKHPNNNIHRYYWKLMKSLNNLMKLVDNLDLTTDWEIENYYNTSRYFYDRGIYSCPAWWANPEHGMWSPNLIYRGVELLMRAALNAQIALIHAGKSNVSEGYFDSISYYQGLLLMELSTITKKNLMKLEKKKKQ
jgi:alpha-amylase/alpha-mannosidase (GH57 family)